MKSTWHAMALPFNGHVILGLPVMLLSIRVALIDEGYPCQMVLN